MIIEHRLPPNHPAAEGHFPGNPIIPGAVLLAETLRLLQLESGLPWGACRIRSAKFPHPARPGDRLRIELSDAGASQARFRCQVGSVTVLVGEVQWSASPSA